MKKIFLLGIACALIIIYFGLTKVPSNFPVQQTIKIDSELSTQQIGNYLKEKKVISSPFLFKLIARNIKAGEYYFAQKESIFSIINRLTEGKGNLPVAKITIPEGSNNEQIAGIIWGKVPDFDAPQFIKKAKKYQGRLFPDTYNIPLTADEDIVISLLRNTFDKKIGTTTEDIVRMAAILEEEGNAKDNRKMIADILWRRIKIGMPLQVDVAMETYKKRGFPALPISNPGLESIEAAKNPTPNPYLYYISDEDGIFHYAKTYEEHLVNIQKYLKK